MDLSTASPDSASDINQVETVIQNGLRPGTHTGKHDESRDSDCSTNNQEPESNREQYELIRNTVNRVNLKTQDGRGPVIDGQQNDYESEDSANPPTSDDPDEPGEITKITQNNEKAEHQSTNDIQSDSIQTRNNESPDSDKLTKSIVRKEQDNPPMPPTRRSSRNPKPVIRLGYEWNSSEVTTGNQRAQPVSQSQEKPTEVVGTHDKEFVVDRIISHGTNEDPEHPTAAVGETTYRVRWYGFEKNEDTYEPIQHLPRNKIVSYCKRKNTGVSFWPILGYTRGAKSIPCFLKKGIKNARFVYPILS